MACTTATSQETNQMAYVFQHQFQGNMCPPIFAEHLGQHQCDGSRRKNTDILLTGLAETEKEKLQRQSIKTAVHKILPGVLQLLHFDTTEKHNGAELRLGLIFLSLCSRSKIESCSKHLYQISVPKIEFD